MKSDEIEARDLSTLRVMMLLACAFFSLPCADSEAQLTPIPEDFPRFVVPGHEAAMDSVRELYWLHYPGAGPKATLWDEWLTMPSLWPAVETDGYAQRFRAEWSRALSGRDIDDEGYVATHQHASIAHQRGWPFPFWKQGGPDTWGWHFSLAGVPNGWHGTEVRDQAGWLLAGGEDLGVDADAWRLRLTAPNAAITTPPMHVDVFQSPFIQLRWSATGLGNARPFIEWTTEEYPEFGASRRMHFAPVETDGVEYTMIPLYRHPEWRGTITRLRIGFGNAEPVASVGIQALFTQYDTRHNINNANFVRDCANYILWSGDLNFLRDQITRMRRALRYAMEEFHTREEGVVLTDWVGHGGRSGIRRDADGTKTLLYGRGVGNNYWDLLPFGHKDTYATIQMYDALRQMAALEAAVARHPEWGIPGGIEAFEADDLNVHADQLKETGNDIFWNAKTQRFHAGVDLDGASHDYGFTFLNLEAVYYGFATVEHARAILDWVSGERIVEGDTATGDDIYHWRFGPRATTKRNIDYYGWFWSGPESIPWGGQVQDGGAVLGFSFHDLMSRLDVRGADDAWGRLRGVIEWFDEVQDAGGYRAYYDGSRDGTLQGGGTAGGLGCDKEFFESVMVPQIMLEGFLGFSPMFDGFRVDPKLPSNWPSLRVTRVLLRDVVYEIEATAESLDVHVVEVGALARTAEAFYLPEGEWEMNGEMVEGEVRLEVVKGMRYRFVRKGSL